MITIQQGATFTMLVTALAGDGSPITFTGCTARMKIRTGPSGPVLLSLTDEEVTDVGVLTIGEAEGTVNIRIEAVATASLNFTRGSCDLEVVFEDGYVFRLFKDEVVLDKESTY